MSASSKKKLRKEQSADTMTQRQQTEMKEAKKLKIYTVVFSVVIAAMLIFTAATVGYQTVSNSGYLARNNVAATVGDHELTSAELNYFYINAVSNYCNEYSDFISYFIDLSTPLDQQVYFNDADGKTWADYFLEAALSNAAATYALADAAKAEGFTLTEEQLTSINSQIESLDLYAQLNKFSNGKAYLKAMYGNGATTENYRAYAELTTLAQSYQTAYYNGLSYTDEDLRAAEAENFDLYSSFSYNVYRLDSSKFLQGGVTDEEGNTTYSDEEKAAALAKAEEAAKSLVSEEIVTLDDLNAAIAALSINAESETAVASTACEDYSYNSISDAYKDWLANDSRVAGDKEYFAVTSTSTDEEGNETTVTNGYYVVFFNACNDNIFPLANVRHILIAPEGGTYNSSTGLYDYTDEQIAAAHAEAEAMLEAWKNGDANEESFAALANEESADGDGTTGGLYEDVFPGQMVESFNDWCFAEGRQSGDTGIVDTVYGSHIIYYVGDSDTMYRDYMIENDLRATNYESWYTAIVENTTSELLNAKYMSTSKVLNMGY